MATKKATATINAATATVKPIAMHTVADIHDLFVNAIGNAPLKVNFSDAKQQYTGLTDFSVNFKKSFYKVYMSAENVDICTSIDSTLSPAASVHDTKSGARDFSIVFMADKFDTLKKCIDSVIAAAVKRAAAVKPAEKPAKAKKPTAKKPTAKKPATAKKSVPAEKPAAVTE